MNITNEQVGLPLRELQMGLMEDLPLCYLPLLLAISCYVPTTKLSPSIYNSPYSIFWIFFRVLIILTLSVVISWYLWTVAVGKKILKMIGGV